MEKNKNNKSFGILFFIVFLLVAFWPIINSEPIRIWSLIISLIFLVLGILNSKILTPFKITWIKFVEFLGYKYWDETNNQTYKLFLGASD